MNPKEYSFIQAIKNNDPAGLRQIYQEFLPRIKTLITSNGGSFEDAKDVFQDALVVLFKKVQEKDFVISSSFYTLLYGICRNLWGNRLQKRSRSEVTLLDDYKYTTVPGLDQLIEKQEEEKVFWEAFQQLGQDCRQLLQLFFAKVKMVEIVERLGLSSVGYAKKRKFQCKEKLINLVKADERYSELKAR